MKIHEHIATPELFRLISSNKRPYFIFPVDEDENPVEGDIVELHEFDSETREYTGNLTLGKVKYVHTNAEYGLLDGYMIISLEILYTSYEQQLSQSNN